MFNGIKANLKEPSYLSYLVPIRIALGFFFFHAGWQKLTTGFISKNMLYTLLSDWVQNVPYLWYKNFLLNVAIPHSMIFGFMVTYGEILVGLALIFGFATRFSALMGIFMNLNYELASGWRPGAGSVVNKIFVVCGLMVFLAAAGRSFGIDRILRRKYPRIPLW